MELKWLEDFVCIASEAHFSRAAVARRITQSALSRRIKALETWVGEELLDRSGHPIQLTNSGTKFLPVAKAIINEAYESRSGIRAEKKQNGREVVFGSLHTLALFELPNRIAALQDRLGPFSAHIIADTRTLGEYLESLAQGHSDFFLCYCHPAITMEIDAAEFSFLELRRDTVSPYIASHLPQPDLSSASGDAIPYLGYSGTSFMAKATQIALSRALFVPRLELKFEASLAESLYTAAMAGLGVAWLPESIGARAQAKRTLTRIDTEWVAELTVCLFKSANNQRPIVQEIWESIRNT